MLSIVVQIVNGMGAQQLAAAYHRQAKTAEHNASRLIVDAAAYAYGPMQHQVRSQDHRQRDPRRIEVKDIASISVWWAYTNYYVIIDLRLAGSGAALCEGVVLLAYSER
jgi:hypothetical protein